MMRGRRIFAVRDEERRDAFAAFAVLFAFVGSLTLLETSRDAIFLVRVPASRLPVMYLVIAAASLLVVSLQARYARLAGRAALSAWTFATGATTAALALLLPGMGRVGVYTLYVWTSVLSTLVLAHFWTLLASIFTVTQAKRIYGLVGSGSVLGAIAGSGLARYMLPAVGGRRTAVLAGAGLALTAALPWLFTGGAARAAEDERPPTASLAENARYAAKHPYARLVVLGMLASAACVTVADYVFKSAAASRVPPRELGAWLASVYLLLNVGSLLAQIFVTSWVLRRFSVATAFAILPALLVASGFGVLATSSLAAAMAVKAADGSLRYSLHRTTSEMLFLPLSSDARRRVKALTDVVGQRGGQAVASLAILALTPWGGNPPSYATLLVALGAAWIVAAYALRTPYLDQFRGRLRGGRILRPEDFPALDLASLETLIEALSSRVDGEVLAALDVLEREGRSRLVPALVLYHPTEEVVAHALALFARAGRVDAVPVIDRLFEHPSPRVRGAAVLARSTLDADQRPLLLRMSFEEAPEVRAAITIALVASGEVYGEDARERVEALLARGRPEARVALAEAIAWRTARGFERVLVRLSRASEPEVRRAALEAMHALHDPVFVEAAIPLLTDERTRTLARDLLVGHGEVGLEALVRVLRDTERAHAVRWRVAQAIPAFDRASAAAALLAQLRREDDGAVRFQIVRGLESIVRRHPEIVLDQASLEDTILATVRRAYRYLSRAALLRRGAREDAARATRGHALLLRVLVDKERNAVDRLFRLLGLAHPLEDFAQIHRGIVGGRRDARASAIELVGNLLREPLRTAVIGLVDQLPDEQRLDAGATYFAPLDLGYEELLGHLLESTSESVLAATVHHIGELGLRSFRDRLLALRVAPHLDGASSDLALALEQLEHREAAE